jgi:hypothetical protein
MINLEELLPLLGRGAVMGAVPGAVAGAIGDKDDRLGGALKGGLAGGALGAAMHGAPSLMNFHEPTQGGLPPRPPSAQGERRDPGVSRREHLNNFPQMWAPGDPAGYGPWEELRELLQKNGGTSHLEKMRLKETKSAMINHLSPNITAALKTAGLHRLTGEMYGVGEMTAPRAAGLLGAASYLRRKQAALVKGGLESLAAVLTDRGR